MAAFRDWLDKLFGKDDSGKIVELNSMSIDYQHSKDLWAYRLALNVACERYASLLSKCEIRTFINGNEDSSSENHYLLNVQPNPNQSAAEFKRQIVRQLILSPEHECLIIRLDKVVGADDQAFYVADSFAKDEYRLTPTYFKNVSVDVYGTDSYPVAGVFSGDKAIYIKYQNSELDVIFDEMRRTYADLIENAVKAGQYRQKYTLSLDQTAQAEPNFEKNFSNLLNEQFGAFIKGDNSVLPLYAGMTVDQLSNGADLGQNASVADKDVDNQIDEIISKVGMAFNIPKSIMMGEFSDSAFEQMLTFCIDPMAELITQAFNRKWYGKAMCQKGTYCKLDTARARHYDMHTVSADADKLISSGLYTINEVRRRTGDSPVDSKFGDVHFVTKNYSTLSDYATAEGDKE